MKVLVRWLLLAAALLLVTHLYSGVVVTSFGAAMIAARLRARNPDSVMVRVYASTALAFASIAL